jgi:hypothetical protein
VADTLTKKQIEQLWDELRDSIKSFTPVNLRESIEEKKKRIAHLQKNPEEGNKFYYPKFSYAESAPFHKKATQRIVNNAEWYEVRSWSRELAKDTRTMFEVLHLALTKKIRYVLMVSNSYDNAEAFLEPYRAQLDSNQRIINDYGVQEKIGKWNAGDFTTRAGVRFRAIGAGQNPRGTRNEEARPDVIIITDVDTDEDVRNKETINKRWDWIEKALIGTRSISKPTRIIFLGNIIAKDCCVVRAQQYADYVDIINIRDANGKSTWPQKNTEEMIDRVLSKISYKTQQGEYYNNPITEGGIFKEMYYKKMRPLKEYRFLCCYIDLSYKSTAKNDYKFAVLMGKWKDEYHIIKCFGIQGTTYKFGEGLVDIEKFVNGEVPVFWIAEENFLQDIIRKEIQSVLKTLKSKIVITPDTRDKGDKLSRIETALEPLNRNSKLWLNERLKDDPHMLLLEGQFISLEYGNKRVHDDGPDASEGAKFILDSKTSGDITNVTVGKFAANKNRY